MRSKEVGQLLKQGMVSPEMPEANQRRVDRIVDRAQQQVHIRDVLSLSFGRIWVVFLSLAGVFFKLAADKQIVSKDI